MLKAEGLNGGYGDVQILWDVSLEIGEGQITALVGANGMGKTTLIRTLAGALPAYSGRIVYRGEDITKTSQPKRATMGIMMVPEGRQLYSGLSVEDNLKMGAYVRRDREGIKADLEWIYAILPRLKERRKQLAGTLSGGEAQMCAVGRGLMASPRILLLDELSLGLAPVAVDGLIAVLKDIQEKKNIAVLLVDQDVQVALGIAEKGYVFVHGHVEFSGNSQELLNNPEIQKAYLGI
ncbi:MAG: ABC transporter ATP-binding protein [Spirochaetaceae bacterium]|jgi:branched-chain amino acid transport system ATP-binding protein|nr:ABC transporter ATP-binding protein [Spirochaetaceae bacterium]